MAKTELELANESIEQLKGEMQRITEENALLRAEVTSLRARKDPAPLVKMEPPPAFIFSGSAGGPFAIEGKGFGNDMAAGTLLIDDRNIVPTRWKDHSIKGVIPGDMKPGEHTVTVNGTKVKVKF